MGLDMYLSRKTYVKNWYHMDDSEKHTITITGGREDSIDINKISYIIEEVGCWRKANQIHRWFVENVQNGEDDRKEYYVDTDDLKRLYDICKRIKEDCVLVDGEISNPEIAEELLPTTSGFFFGGTEYDQYYMGDIKNTINILKPLLETKADYYYQSSW